MLGSVSVHGEKQDFRGNIVEINLDDSGFIYTEDENGFIYTDFEEGNRENIKLKISLEVAQSAEIIPVPKKRNYLPNLDDDISETVPLVKEPDRIETQTVIIYHDVLEKSNILDLDDMISNAFEALDTTFPIHELWKDIRGKEINAECIDAGGILFAESVEISDIVYNEEPNLSQLTKEAYKILEDELPQDYDDMGVLIRIPDDNILHLEIKNINNYPQLNYKSCNLELDANADWVLNCEKQD